MLRLSQCKECKIEKIVILSHLFKEGNNPVSQPKQVQLKVYTKLIDTDKVLIVTSKTLALV